MKKNHLLTALTIGLFLSGFTTLSAQNTTFRLSDYKNPDYLYQSLDLNFGLASNASYNKLTGFNDGNRKSFSLNTQAGASYSRYLNSAKAQGEFWSYFNAGIGSTSGNYQNTNGTSNIENKVNSSNHKEYLDLTGLRRFYNPKQGYIEINGALTIDNRGNSESQKVWQNNTLNTSQETKDKDFYNQVSGSFLIGKGRIEQVQDARMALYVLDDLGALNREKRAVTDEDVVALAQLMTKLKYKRFFDYRLRKIAEITAIDSLLQQSGIVSAADAAYFTSLNDNWAYANNPVRQTGHRIYTGLEAGFNYNYQYEKMDNNFPEDLVGERTTKNKMAALKLVVGYAYEKPTSRSWQNFAHVKGGVGIQQYYQNRVNNIEPDPEIETEFYTDVTPAIDFSGDCGFGYYPNSRTWLNLSWYLNSSWQTLNEGETKSDKPDHTNSFNIYTGPQFSAYFYLSEKLRLNLSYNAQFYYKHDNFETETEGVTDKEYDNTYWGQAVNASLTYSLF